MDKKLSIEDLTPKKLASLQEDAYLRDIKRLQKKSKQFIRVTCPACQKDDAAVFFEKYGFFYDQCRVCETIYMNPRPTQALMEDYYSHSENYAFYVEHIFPATEDSRREKLHRPWLEQLLKDTKGLRSNDGALLEVGPGFGTFAVLAKESAEFKDVIVVEPTPELAATCRSKGLTVVEMPIEYVEKEKLPLIVSTIVAFEVIEHLYEPRSFIKKCGTIMESRGVLVLSCPNGLGFDIQILGSKSIAVDTEHVNLFNPKSLTLALVQEGFEVLNLTTPGKLDAEFVREAYLRGEIELDDFLHNVLINKWDEYGENFQKFLIDNNMSSHMWIIAIKK